MLVEGMGSLKQIPHLEVFLNEMKKSREGDLNSRMRLCRPPHSRYVISALGLLGFVHIDGVI